MDALKNIKQAFDVFWVHTGMQKAESVASIHRLFSNQGFRCFLDIEMQNAQGNPHVTMQEALETCRHVVVILSQAFLDRPDPCAELQYAFQRMQWLRQETQHEKSWQSLWIVLFDLTLEEFKVVRKETGDRLPPIHETQLFKYEKGKGKYETWPKFCDELAAQIAEHDRERALVRWEAFLEEWPHLIKSADAAFPRAHKVYELPREETGCRCNKNSANEATSAATSGTPLSTSISSISELFLSKYERALSLSSWLSQRKFEDDELVREENLLEFYRRGALVKSLLSLAMPQNEVFVMGFDGIPEELAGYFRDEEYLSTFVCWIVDRFFDMCDQDRTPTALDVDTAIPFLDVCFDSKKRSTVGRPKASTRSPNATKWDEVSPIHLKDEKTTLEDECFIDLVGTGGGGSYVLGRLDDGTMVALFPDGSLKRAFFDSAKVLKHDHLRISYGCIVPEVIRGLLHLRGLCYWDDALFHVYYISLAMLELCFAIKDLPKLRHAPTKRRLQQLVQLHQEGFDTAAATLGTLTRVALNAAEERFSQKSDEASEQHLESQSGELDQISLVLPGSISGKVKAMCRSVFRPVTMAMIETRLQVESARGGDGKVRWRWIEGTGTENMTIIAAFVSKLVNDISAEETLHIGNVDAGFKVVKGHLGTVATWPGAGGIIVDVEGSVLNKRNWLSEHDNLVSVLNHEVSLGWPLVTAALVKAFKLEGPIKDDEILALLNENPGMLFRPADLVAAGYSLGLRNVSIECLFRACDAILGGGLPTERACCLRLCLECLVRASCKVEGTMGIQLVRALKECVQPIVVGAEQVGLVCNRVIPSDGLQYVEVSMEPLKYVLFGNNSNIWVIDPESGKIAVDSSPADNPDLNGGIGMVSEFFSSLS